MTLLFNPWFWLAAILALGASNATTAWFSYESGKDHCIAEQIRDTAVAEIAANTAAEAIAKIEVKNVTIRQPLETIVRTEKVFTDCRSGPSSVGLLNSTPGIAQPASGAGKLPRVGGPD